jgi:hypothetical protein
MLKSAKFYVQNECSIIATGDNKRAIMPWKEYQNRIATIDELKVQFEHDKCKGLAVICGQVSSNLEVIDVDLKYDISGTLWQRLKEAAPIINDLYCVQTKSGGYHIYYRCEHIEGNMKLANRPATDEEIKATPHLKEVVLIETRGEGGYVIAPPTDGYTKVNEFKLTVISIEQREELLTACRSFNEVVQVHKPPIQTTVSNSFDTTPWDDYNNKANVVELLERHGWKSIDVRGERTVMLRPGVTDSKSSGDYHHGLKLFKVFTTSSQFEPNKGYSPYAVYTILEHNGDYSKAAKQLITDGFGDAAKSFDKRLLNKVNKSLGAGFSKEKIVEQLMVENSLAKNVAEQTIEDILLANGEKVLTFWEVIESKSGKDIKILRHKFINFLFESGFHLFFYEKGNSIYRMVYQRDGFVEEATAESIKKHIKNYIQNLPPKFDSITPNELLEIVLKGSDSYFGKGLIEFLDAKDIDLLKDDADTAYFPFINGIVKITKDGAKLLSYGEVGKAVWKSQVIDFKIDVDNDFDYQLCEFYKFMEKVSGEEDEKLVYMISLIGYLLHRYKDPSRPWAVVLAEETEDEKNGGGTGKGIAVKALSYMANVERVDGKNFKLDKNFAFQRVGLDTKVVAIEDVRKNVDFEGFYSIITEGITVEKKNKDELFIPYKDSPKILFTTNYTIPSIGNHAKRRQRVFEFSNFFSSKYTPADLFGHKLFDDWDQDEWNRFYNLMFTCVAFYFNNGVKETENGNKLKRKHIKINFGEELLEWWDGQIEQLFENHKPFRELYTSFLTINDFDKKDYSQKRFKKALEECCEKFEFTLDCRKNIQTRLSEYKIIK